MPERPEEEEVGVDERDRHRRRHAAGLEPLHHAQRLVRVLVVAAGVVLDVRVGREEDAAARRHGERVAQLEGEVARMRGEMRDFFASERGAPERGGERGGLRHLSSQGERTLERRGSSETEPWLAPRCGWWWGEGEASTAPLAASHSPASPAATPSGGCSAATTPLVAEARVGIVRQRRWMEDATAAWRAGAHATLSEALEAGLDDRGTDPPLSSGSELPSTSSCAISWVA